MKFQKLPLVFILFWKNTNWIRVLTGNYRPCFYHWILLILIHSSSAGLADISPFPASCLNVGEWLCPIFLEHTARAREKGTDNRNPEIWSGMESHEVSMGQVCWWAGRKGFAIYQTKFRYLDFVFLGRSTVRLVFVLQWSCRTIVRVDDNFLNTLKSIDWS